MQSSHDGNKLVHLQTGEPGGRERWGSGREAGLAGVIRSPRGSLDLERNLVYCAQWEAKLREV